MVMDDPKGPSKRFLLGVPITDWENTNVRLSEKLFFVQLRSIQTSKTIFKTVPREAVRVPQGFNPGGCLPAHVPSCWVWTKSSPF